MINILIADDEHHIVNYIATLFDSMQETDLEVYKAYSGIEALEYVEKTSFDLILLDINMPGASGLEVAQKVSFMWPRSKILFLTAYDNFDYIYKAISFNCCGYLLKVETDEMIIIRISDIIKDIKNELSSTNLINEAKQKSMYLSHLLHQSILKGLVSGWDRERVKTELSIVSPDNPVDPSSPFYLMYTCILPGSCNSVADNRYTPPILLNIQFMEHLLCKKFTCHVLQCDHEHMLWFFQSTGDGQRQTDITYIKHIADDFVNISHSKNNVRLLSILYSEAVSLKDISKIYYLLQRYADHLYQNDEPYVVFLNNESLRSISENTNNNGDIAKTLVLLSTAIYAADNLQFNALLSELKRQCVILKSMHSLSAIKIYLSISLLLIKYIEQNKLQEPLSMKAAIYPLYSPDFANWELAFDYLQKISHIIFEFIDLKKENRNDHIICIIKNYIVENISSNITLEKISALVNYNESYISRLFKDITGEGISEYINHIRLDKAKNLLVTTSLSIQNIADSTGFDTSQYFSSVFKKNMGVSPTNYRLYNIN